MIDTRISVAIVSAHVLLLLATPIRWLQHGWRDYTSYPSVMIMQMVDEELVPVGKLLKLTYAAMMLHFVYATVLNPLAVRIRERERMERERVWRDEQLIRIARMQREEREDTRARQKSPMRRQRHIYFLLLICFLLVELEIILIVRELFRQEVQRLMFSSPPHEPHRMSQLDIDIHDSRRATVSTVTRILISHA